MNNNQTFIEFSLDNKVLRFGNFTLKSGRQSPYFFNAGLFYKGNNVSRLGEFYADLIIENNIEFDVLFGPAYKGIPIATATAVALHQKGKDISLCFNRKEQKTHGEKGSLIGAPLSGQKVVMIDDVITAGTAFYESKSIIEQSGGELTAVVISLDRQEKGGDKQSIIQDIYDQFKIPVMSIATLENIKHYLKVHQEHEKLQEILLYQTSYGAT